MRNFMRKLHLWVSIPFGLVIVITCFTGAMLVFESEFIALCSGGASSVESNGDPLPVWKVVECVEPSLGDGVEVTGVVIPSDACEAYRVNLSKPRRAALYVNQYTGEVLGMYKRPPFFDVVRRLHRWLMDTRPSDGGVYWGKAIVGASTLAFVVILIAGIVIWWPRNRKMLVNRLRIAVSKGKNRFWYDLHVAGGIYAVLFMLAMALTGLTWSYGWYSNALYGFFPNEKSGRGDVAMAVEEIYEPGAATPLNPTALNGEIDAVSSVTLHTDAVSGATELAADNNSPYYSWQVAVDAVSGNADFNTITVSVGSVSVALGGFGNQRAYDKYSFDEGTGAIIGAEYYCDSSCRSKARGWVRTLHVGTWGGLFSKILYFLAALLGASLPLTGYWLWIRRLYLKRKGARGTRGT